MLKVIAILLLYVFYVSICICECVCKRLRFKLFLFLFILCSRYKSWSVLWKPCYQERKRCTTTINRNVVCVSETERKRNMRSWGTNVLDSWVMPCQAAVLTLVSSTPLWMFVCVFVSVHEWVTLTVTWASMDPVGDKVAGWSAVWVSWNI